MGRLLSTVHTDNPSHQALTQGHTNSNFKTVNVIRVVFIGVQEAEMCECIQKVGALHSCVVEVNGYGQWKESNTGWHSVDRISLGYLVLRKL